MFKYNLERRCGTSDAVLVFLLAFAAGVLEPPGRDQEPGRGRHARGQGRLGRNTC